ncbi:MAG: preprotein translocase subunit YajC [Desulfobacteraceae bacterium 4572_130]|nr:MAG: preprotein translocase subunit YajC [Desulfobacteraceae bacterium 4572_130]
MINTAFAMGQGAEGSQAGGFTAFVPLILMFVIFYFLLIRPQQKKAKEHRNMLDNLRKGDRVVTSGGIHGVIISIDETTIVLEVGDKIKFKVNRGNIGASLEGYSTGDEKKDKK